MSLKRRTNDTPKFVTEGSALGMGAQRGLAVPVVALHHHSPCPAQRVQHPCGTGDTDGTQQGDPVDAAQGDPAPVAPRDFLSAMGVQGVSEAAGGGGSQTAGAATFPKEEVGKEGSPAPRGGVCAHVTPCAGLELWGISYRRVLKNL